MIAMNTYFVHNLGADRHDYSLEEMVYGWPLYPHLNLERRKILTFPKASRAMGLAKWQYLAVMNRYSGHPRDADATNRQG